MEFNFLTGKERELDSFPSPDSLWSALRTSQPLPDDLAVQRLLTPAHHVTGMSPRYYQEIAINRSVEAILQGRRRILLTMATGTGKTFVAFQILLETVELSLEPGRGTPTPQDPLSIRSQHPCRRSQGQNFRPLRRRTLEDREWRSQQGTRDVLQHLPGHRQGRAASWPI